MPFNPRIEVRSAGDPDVARLEHDVYVRAGYIEPNEQRVVLENVDYPSYRYVVALDNEEVIGSLRVVIDPRPRYGLYSLKCFKAFALHSWVKDILSSAPPEEIVQVGTMVIHEDFRCGKAFQGIFRKALELSYLEGARYAISTIDERLFNTLRRRRIGAVCMGEPRQYMGSVTVPAFVDLVRLQERYGMAAQTSLAMAAV